ncbi:MAG: phosphoribosylformylglycinamidine cyclo-ligase [candidate division WOR-3 bacterium]|nr:phosphoribosylformylglycinamidine cyclo-ligase [candidate division WOR-3 bacterium]MDW8150290.1 phosphoribosylformylglycinamidine cyclo-ligase [candidate division WOR-3 bacterium]
MLYKDAGVDIDKANEFVKYIKDKVGENIGLFGGLFEINELLKKYNEPVLVSSCDGVGTKVEIARKLKKYKNIGIDLVAINVNDVYVMKAKPLFFLDYYAMHYLDLDISKELIDGIIEGCNYAECKLIGGETAQMPAIFKKNKFDIAGFVVAIAEKSKIPRKEKLEIGDIIIGISSNGFHSNGYSLIRKIINQKGIKLNRIYEEVSENETIGEILLRTTRIYKEILDIDFKSAVHITGGGFYENIKRVLREDLDARIKINYEIPRVFKFFMEMGNVSIEEAFRVWNMGIGMVLILDEKVLDNIKIEYVLLGRIEKGNGRVCVDF